MKNTLPVHDGLMRLTSDCQDMWHYAALIKPPPDGRVSTFCGSPAFRGLKGKVMAYEALKRIVQRWQMEPLEAFLELSMADIESINSEIELVEQTGYVIHALNQVCVASNFDGYTGRFNR